METPDPDPNGSVSQRANVGHFIFQDVAQGNSCHDSGQKDKTPLESTQDQPEPLEIPVGTAFPENLVIQLIPRKERKRRDNSEPTAITIATADTTYDICQDLHSHTANISLAQLLQIAPAIRKQLQAALTSKRREGEKTEIKEICDIGEEVMIGSEDCTDLPAAHSSQRKWD